MVGSNKVAQNLSLTGFDLAFVEAWKVIDVTQDTAVLFFPGFTV